MPVHNMDAEAAKVARALDDEFEEFLEIEQRNVQLKAAEKFLKRRISMDTTLGAIAQMMQQPKLKVARELSLNEIFGEGTKVANAKPSGRNIKPAVPEAKETEVRNEVLNAAKSGTTSVEQIFESTGLGQRYDGRSLMKVVNAMAADGQVTKHGSRKADMSIQPS